ncbi:MAG: PDZ domain-containing protein, partial [Flavobacteriales bacterium]
GDILLSIDDQEIHHVDEVIQTIRNHKKGDVIKVKYERNGKKNKAKITLDERDMEITQTFPGFGQFGSPIFIDTLLNNWNLDEMQAQKKAFLGVMPHPENENIAGAKIDVQPGSSADKMGLIGGDIVTQINERVITDFQSLSDAVATFEPGESIRIIVLRDGKIKSFEGPLGEREVSQSGDFRIFRDYKGRDEGGNYTYDFELDMNASDLQNQMQILMDSLLEDGLQLQFDFPNKSQSNQATRQVGIENIQAEDRMNSSWLPSENATPIEFNQFSLYTELDSDSKIRVKLESANTQQPIRIELLDVTGTVVFLDERKNSTGIYDNSISYGHFPSGIYFLIIKQGESVQTQKLRID